MADAQAWEQGWSLGSREVEGQRAHKQALYDQELEGKINELVENRKAIQGKLPLLLDEKGNPTPQYTEAIGQLTENAKALREIYHPEKNPNAIQNFGHLLTDALHVTKPEDRIAKEGQKRANAAAGDVKEAESVAAAAPAAQPVPKTPAELWEAYKQNYKAITGKEVPPEVAEQFARTGKVTEPKPEAENFKPQALTLSDGKTISAQYDTKSGKWKYLNGEEIPDDLLKGSNLPQKSAGTGPIRAWKKDANGRVTSFLIDRQTNKPVPGSEDSDILPPAYLTPRISTGVYHWVDENNQIHETPESHSTSPVLPSGTPAQPKPSGEPNQTSPNPQDLKKKAAKLNGGLSQTPNKAAIKDKILGYKTSAPLNHARQVLSDSARISSLGDKLLDRAKTTPNDMSEADTQFVLSLIRSEAGRVNQQEIATLFNAGGITEAPDRWVAKVGHGQLSPNLRKQLVDFTHDMRDASVDAVTSLSHNQDGGQTPAGGGTKYKTTATNPQTKHKIGTNDDPKSPTAKWFDLQTGNPI